MDSTTLVTFWFKTPPEVRSVGIFGSWDNFANGVAMQHDKLKGKGSWTACPRFDRIICDGVRPNHEKPRSGALKQGGRYWYYFKLDDEYETYDQTKINTASCPLLPGQMVNVLDIPVEMVEPPQRVSSASAMATISQIPQMTYDPADRYKKVHRKHPNKLLRHYSSTEALREGKMKQTFDIMEGGAVQRPFQLSPVPQQRLDSSGKKSLKRVRGHLSSYQQAGSCLVNSPSSAMESMIEAISTNLPELRPFGPMPSYESDVRPATRYGTADGNASAFGLGIDFNGFGSFHLSSAVDTCGGPVQEPNEGRLATPVDRRNSLTFTDSDGTYWPFPHPNPLKGNPNQARLPTPTHFFSSPRYSASPSSFPSPVQLDTLDRSIDEESSSYHPQYPSALAVKDANTAATGAGLHDMLSPTFTAATASTISENTPSPYQETFPSSINSYPFSSSSSTNEAQQEEEPSHTLHTTRSMASIRSQHSSHRLYTSGYKYSTNFEPYTRTSSTHSSSNASKTTLKQQPAVLFGSEPLFRQRSLTHSSMSLDEPEISDFASSVFGALAGFAR